ncbi:MAG: hypothetical protein CK427_09015 [Leptospira sp.]|nr:MAG: hypothetical protein CK427_09015 [Leptospira sp.]
MVNQKTILLVEDEYLIAHLNIKILENMNYEVVHCNSGESALDLIQTKNKKVDLILMDIDLGEGMNGTKTAESILQLTELPILFLSARSEKEMISQTETISSYGYVVKNSEPNVLKASIKMAFRLFEAHQKIKSQNSKLEESKKMFIDMTDNVPGVIYQFRFRPDGSSYFSFISSKAADIFGLPNDPLSKHWELGKNIHEEDRERFLKSVQKAVLEKSKWEFEGRIHSISGEVNWFLGKSIPSIIGDELVFNGIMIKISKEERIRN